jgi:cytochrome c553
MNELSHRKISCHTFLCQALLCLFALAGSGWPSAPALAAGPAPLNPEISRAIAQPGDVAAGKRAYRTCQGCHRADAGGLSNGTYPQLAGQHPSVVIKQVLDIRAGRRDSPKMEPFIAEGEAGVTELVNIAAYLATLPPPARNGQGPGRQLDLGKHLYDRDCAACHGRKGEGDGARFYPRLASQHYLYLVRETRESRDQGRRNPDAEMVKVLRHYSNSDIEAVSDYLSRQRGQ